MAVEGYTFRTLRSPIDPSVGENILALCKGYGDHYEAYFGRDLQWRFQEPGNIFCIALPSDSTTVVSHAMIAYDPTLPESSGFTSALLGHVFTAVPHRRKGLATALLRLVLEQLDSAYPRSICVLGTGSPGAGALYESYGFRRRNGSFDSGNKGYNPEDLGEVIMARTGPNAPDFDAMYGADVASADVASGSGEWVVEPLSRANYAAAVVLLSAAEEATGKLPGVGVDAGLEAEEQLLKAMAGGAAVHLALSPAARHALAVRYCPPAQAAAQTYAPAQFQGAKDWLAAAPRPV